MDNAPLVSVVIPAYNRANTIKRCIDSILAQTYENLEIIVVDDCSQDGTYEAVRAMNNDKIRCFRLARNLGACIARNTGVENARGDIVAFQDSDDSWHPDKLERQVAFMLDGGYDFVYCGLNRINEKTGESKTVGLRQPFAEYQKDLWSRLIEGNWISTQTMVCRKDCFDKIGFDPDVKKFQDWDFALQAAAAGYRIGQLDEVLVDVYLQENSITNTVVKGDHKIRVIKKHEKDIASREMAAQYYKSLADAQRRLSPFEAGMNYCNSFFREPGAKKLLLAFLCFTRLIKFYKTR